jgi:hypothetical protein
LWIFKIYLDIILPRVGELITKAVKYAHPTGVAGAITIETSTYALDETLHWPVGLAPAAGARSGLLHYDSGGDLVGAALVLPLSIREGVDLERP